MLEPMVRRIGAGLALGLLVAACGSSSHSSSTPSAAATGRSSSSSASASTSASRSSSSAPTSSASAPPVTTSSSTTSTSSSTGHSHNPPPNSTPRFVVELKIAQGDTLTPPSVAIGGHTLVDLSITNDTGSIVKLELAHGAQPVFSRSLPTGSTTTKLPALANATYTLLLDGKPRGTLTIGAAAGP